MVSLIIGLVADISAGKDTVARYLAEKYSFERFTLSDILREIAKKRNIEPNRENLMKIIRKLREKEGETALVKRAIKRFEKDRVVIAGIRKPEEIVYLRKQFPGKVKIIRLTADAKIRFKRIKKRARIGDPKTLKEFLEQEKKEHKEFDYESIFEMADYTIKNNGTLEELYKKIDSILQSIK
ncbi:AAA family ATPase [Candidatus Woesearchaeota archaeon]|nr:AAA family ATPase [Candidatus Woesearchaeota archaeon]